MDSFREYKNLKPKRKKRIPIIRTLLGLFLLYGVYSSGAVQKAYQFIEEKNRHPQKELTYADFETEWREGCEFSHGSPFTMKKKFWGGCSWTLKSAADISMLPENSFVRYVANIPGSSYPQKVHWMSDTANFWKPKIIGVQSDSTVNWYFYWMMADSSYAWVRADGCRYPGVCPRNPLSGGAIPIFSNFDFGGREELLLKDLFIGIGEAPVLPILAAEIVSVEKDSLGYKIFLNHGGNLFSRVSGISLISPGIQAGAKIQADDVLGRLSPSDSSAFFLEVLRNGRFVRWDDFYRETHVAEANYVTRFRMDAGF